MAWDDKEEPLQQAVFGGVLGDLLDRSRLHSAEKGCGPVWGGEYAPDDAVDAVRAAIPQAQISAPVTATLAAGVALGFRLICRLSRLSSVACRSAWPRRGGVVRRRRVCRSAWCRR